MYLWTCDGLIRTRRIRFWPEVVGFTDIESPEIPIYRAKIRKGSDPE